MGKFPLWGAIGPDKGPSSEAQEWILQWIPPAGMDSFYLITHGCLHPVANVGQDLKLTLI